MRKKEKWLCDILREDIAKKTGFNDKKINLILSKRNDDNIPVIDYHEFEYEGKKHVLIGQKLKCE